MADGGALPPELSSATLYAVQVGQCVVASAFVVELLKDTRTAAALLERVADMLPRGVLLDDVRAFLIGRGDW